MATLTELRARRDALQLAADEANAAAMELRAEIARLNGDETGVEGYLWLAKAYRAGLPRAESGAAGAQG